MQTINPSKLTLNEATMQYELQPDLRATILQHAHDASQPLCPQRIPNTTVVVVTSTFQAHIVTDCDVNVQEFYDIKPLSCHDRTRL